MRGIWEREIALSIWKRRNKQMRAEIVVPQSSPILDSHQSLLTYRVPEELASRISAGQVVSVPFGERTVPGIVWALDAADDTPDDGQAVPASISLRPLKSVSAILMPDPLMQATHRALAEWVAEYYAAPLASAARLFLPPGLLSTSRQLLQVGEDFSAAQLFELSSDEGAVMAMLRERGTLGRDMLVRVLGKERARRVVQTLRQRRLVTWRVELAGSHQSVPRQRYVRLSASPENLESWRREARRALDEGVVARSRRPEGQRVPQLPRQNERLLRQLAVLELLERELQAGLADDAVTGWRVEELQKFTQATPSALGELVQAGLIRIEDQVARRHDPLSGYQIARTQPLPLSPAQAAAVQSISAACGVLEPGRSGRVFLLHGITGSGKTEVYLQVLAAVLAQGRRGIVLVPEIALTPQATSRFAGRFPGRVAILHSGLSSSERVEEWHRIRRGEVDIVLGSRSALFAPVDRLGLIVVDEEQEAAYKQDRRPTYLARDVAVELGRLTGATVVLGSATPSVESYWRASQGIYSLLELRERATSAGSGTKAIGLPPVRVVDLRAELRAGNTSILSEALRQALHQTLDNGEQAILFLNRRGAASSVVCRECGYAARCSHCDVGMTFHAAPHILLCHYCSRREPVPVVCPVCRSAGIRHFGVGTERVQQTVERLFPQARVLRWDRDTAHSRSAHEELLRAFADRRADILVGTQMIAKGLDLPGVTLVGVISADVALFLPDFRASERAFALLTQVAGRAGRGNLPGSVLIQTFNPDHFCIQSASRHDYAGFFAAEISARERYGYPPFRRFVKCTYEHADRYSAQIEATLLANRLQQVIDELQMADTDIVGPAPAFMERLRGRYRWQLIVRSPHPSRLLGALTRDDLAAGWAVDMDPATTL
jgi:primosomal protein N' (replication factor Y)